MNTKALIFLLSAIATVASSILLFWSRFWLIGVLLAILGLLYSIDLHRYILIGCKSRLIYLWLKVTLSKHMALIRAMENNDKISKLMNDILITGRKVGIEPEKGETGPTTDNNGGENVDSWE